MEELGILDQAFVSSVDIMFLVVAGWTSVDLANFPPDMIRSLVRFELKRNETIEKFRDMIQNQKIGSFNTSIRTYEAAMAA